ncbi:hypothetical protein FS749_012384 [Ceratobasidium sp. UAMH 11750]|nr:hypothetical protein FS749_012384 [Ceratobasidium sp. UAMH 11750]
MVPGLRTSPLLFGLLSSAAVSLAGSYPPEGAITIGGAKGQYPNISIALQDTTRYLPFFRGPIAAVPNKYTLRSNVYFVYAGTYNEQVFVNRPNVTIIGESRQTTRFNSNTVHVTNNLPANKAGSNDLSGTVRIGSTATGVKLYNLNISNTYGKPVDQSQAIALSVQAGYFGAYAVALKGYQDTLLANVGTQFYGRSYINGAVDFIFGQKASIWITRSEIETLGTGYITASGRLTDDANWYVIDRTKVYSNGMGSVYLGRPWR